MTESRDSAGPSGTASLEDQIHALVDCVASTGVHPVDADEVMRRHDSAVFGDHTDPDLAPNAELVSVTRGDPKNRRHQWLVALAAAVIVIGGFAGAYFLFAGSDSARVATTPAGGSGFAEWGPGWHEVDLGPTSNLSVRSLAWFQDRLIAVGGSAKRDSGGELTWKGEAWSFNPSTRKWSAIPAPLLAGASLVVAGDRLVAVGADPDSDWGTGPVASADLWATWEGGRSNWVNRGEIPANSGAETLGRLRLSRPGPQIRIWTGEKVLDFAQGASLDPVTGEVGLIEFPKGVLSYTHLNGTYPVWTGREVVWPSPAISVDAAGLAWGPDGRNVREVPAPPVLRYAKRSSNSAEGLAVFARDGDVFLIAVDGTDEPYVQKLNIETGKWTTLTGPDRLIDPACFDTSASTSTGDFVFIPCGEVDPVVPMVMRGSGWFDTSPFPSALSVDSESPTLTMTPAGAAVILSSTFVGGSDPAHQPWAAVWVPESTSDLSLPQRRLPDHGETTIVPGSDSDQLEPVGAGTPACEDALSKLPDVTRYLRLNFDAASHPGMGGMSEAGGGSTQAESPCSRFWVVGDGPQQHVTQGLGSAPLSGPLLGSAGRYFWSEVEDGWKIEYRGTTPWFLLIYAMDADGVASLARSLAELDP